MKSLKKHVYLKCYSFLKIGPSIGYIIYSYLYWLGAGNWIYFYEMIIQYIYIHTVIMYYSK